MNFSLKAFFSYDQQTKFDMRHPPNSGNLHISFKVGEASYENMVVQSNFRFGKKYENLYMIGLPKKNFQLAAVS